MDKDGERCFKLQPFEPSTLGVSVATSLRGEGLELTYSVSGDRGSIKWPDFEAPSQSAGQRRDNLWHSTCFEFFLASREGPDYLEYNFAPNGDWAVFQFSTYRGVPSKPPVKPPCVLRSDAAVGIFTVAIDFKGLASLLHEDTRYLFAMTVILQEPAGQSFWAHRHRVDKPDFHDKALFETFELNT